MIYVVADIAWFGDSIAKFLRYVNGFCQTTQYGAGLKYPRVIAILVLKLVKFFS